MKSKLLLRLQKMFHTSLLRQVLRDIKKHLRLFVSITTIDLLFFVGYLFFVMTLNRTIVVTEANVLQVVEQFGGPFNFLLYWFAMYFIIPFFAYSLFKFLNIVLLKKIYGKALFSVKAFLQFLWRNVLLFVFFMVLGIVLAFFIAGIQMQYIAKATAIIGMLYLLFCYTILSLVHTHAALTGRFAFWKMLQLLITQFPRYVKLYFIDIIFFVIYFLIYHFLFSVRSFGLAYNLKFHKTAFVVFFALSIVVLAFNKLYWYRLFTHYKLEHRRFK